MHLSQELILGFNFIMIVMSFKQADVDRIVVSSDNINFDIPLAAQNKTHAGQYLCFFIGFRC